MCRFQCKFELTPLIFPTLFADASVVTVAINGKYFPVRSSPIDLSSGNTVFSVRYKLSLCVSRRLIRRVGTSAKATVSFVMSVL